MYKILIAEDELPLLRGIKTMIEQLSEQLDVVFCARNGREAAEYMSENHIDILLTDINMPIMNGLELMEYVSSNHKGVRMVVLSGYGEFEYARQALQYGAADYLLKPVDRMKLKAVMEKLVRSLRQEEESKRAESIKQVVIAGKGEREDGQVYILYLCQGAFAQTGLEEMTESMLYTDIKTIEKISSTLLPPSCSVYAFERNEPNERIVLIESEQNLDIGMFAKRLLIADEFTQSRFSIIYHEKKINLKKIPGMARILRKKLRDSIRMFTGMVLSDEQPAHEAEGKSLPALPMEGKEEIFIEELQDCFKRGRIRQVECSRLLQLFFQTVLKEGNTTSEAYEEVTANLLRFSSTPEELIANLRSVLTENQRISGKVSARELAEHIREYIENHLSENLSVSWLAEKYGFVPPYLSRVFKEQTGVNLSSYVQTKRMERAKYLLCRHEEYMMKDIAQMIGYTDPLHFSKAFKGSEGLYPSEYRKKMMEKVFLKEECDNG